ncbi:MAG: hypothetical protein AAF488_06145, partial [Planctomycetota bacterium]
MSEGPPSDPEGADRDLFDRLAVPAGHQNAWADARSKLPPDSSILVHWPECRDGLAELPDPTLALGRLIDLAARVATDESFASRWGSSSAFRRGFLQLAGSSPAMGELLVGSWKEFRPEDPLRSAQDLERDLA